uniref:Carboxylesterase type B domain-containing protein n=1 Tax=Panagrolaimus sp. JU765 TaxID=591449 RepID=A0AC34R4H8_9BILA
MVNPYQQRFQKTLNEMLGCPQTDSAELKKCLKTLNATFVSEMSNKLPQVPFDVARVHWTPVLDKDFYAGKTVDELTRETPPKAVLYGITGSESMIFTFAHPNFVTGAFALEYGITKDEMSTFTLKNYHEKMDGYAFKPERAGCNSKLMQDLIEKFYLSNLTAIRTDPKYYYKSWNDVLSDIEFNVPLYYEIEKKLQYNWPDQYVFLFDWVDPAEVDSYLGVNQCPHGYEIQFLTDMRAYSLDKPWTPLQLKVQKNLVEFYTSFIKTGVPGKNWPKYVFLFDWVDPAEVDSYLGVNQCPHGYEIQFLTDMRAYSLDKPWTPLQLKVQKNLVEFYTSFIKTGVPGQNWPKVTDAERLAYMKITDKMEPGNTFFNRSFLLWRTIVELLGYKLTLADGDQLYDDEF